VKVHLVDGTFELFRAFYGAPRRESTAGEEVGAVRGLLRSLLALLAEPGVTHVAVAFDHVIESFRNELYPGYKTGEGLDPNLAGQFDRAETASRALGLVTWPMVEFEADDALASAALRFSAKASVEQVVIASPDKDLAQCVRGRRVVCVDRMRRKELDAHGVLAKFGVAPGSIPDWLALVGDSADGIPGIPRWGAKSAAAVLAHYHKLDRIPGDSTAWAVAVRGAAALAESLGSHRGEAELFRVLATLRRDVPIVERLDELRWRGPDESALAALGEWLGDPRLLARAEELASRREGRRAS
jgi:5'-3' exonuclease